jgi:hypothetical protein
VQLPAVPIHDDCRTTGAFSPYCSPFRFLSLGDLELSNKSCIYLLPSTFPLAAIPSTKTLEVDCLLAALHISLPLCNHRIHLRKPFPYCSLSALLLSLSSQDPRSSCLAALDSYCPRFSRSNLPPPSTPSGPLTDHSPHDLSTSGGPSQNSPERCQTTYQHQSAEGEGEEDA